MLEPIKTYLSQLKGLSTVEMMEAAKITNLKRFKKGEVIIRTGDVHYNIYVVLSGLVRNYVEMPDGSEKTIRFTKEGMNFSSRSAMRQNEASEETVVALENTVALQFDRRRGEKLWDDYPNLLKLYVNDLNKAVNEAVDHLWLHTVMSPEERYLHVRDNHPDLIQRVQLNHLASFLGVTPISISRIRARIAAKGV